MVENTGKQTQHPTVGMLQKKKTAAVLAAGLEEFFHHVVTRR